MFDRLGLTRHVIETEARKEERMGGDGKYQHRLCLRPKGAIAPNDKRGLAENERVWLKARVYKLWSALALREYIENGDSNDSAMAVSKKYNIDIKKRHPEAVQFGCQVSGH